MALTKREAVRRALADLGPDATPTQMQGHIKKKFGIKMTTDHISTEKGNLRKQQGAASPPPQASAARTVEPKKPAPQSGDAAIGLADIEAVKDLMERMGADSLKKLIDVMAR
jgi:hypothetical protein